MKRLLALCCCFWPLVALAADPLPIRLTVGEMPPYAMASAVDGPGALVEITQELGRRLGTPLEVSFYPWSRAIAVASQTPRTIVLPLTRTDDREPRYRWLVKLYKQQYVFVGLRGNPQLRDPLALKHARLAVLRGTPHKRTLADAGYTNVSECNAIRDCLRMLKQGIIDATYGAEDVHRSATGMDGYKESEFDFSAVFREGEVWLAGSLDFSEEDARKWRTAMDAARADGTVARILRKYGATGS